MPSTILHADGLVRETVTYQECSGRTLFVVTTAPAAGPSGASVVVLSPVGGDHETNYRREVLLARELARHGATTTRFHYAGTGNSGGDPAALTIESMVADGEAVAATGAVGPHVVVGTRLSSLPAVLLADRLGAQRIVLWDPAVSGKSFFRQLSRTLAARQMRAYDRHESEDDRPLLTQLSEDGFASVAGYSVNAALHQSSQALELAELPVASGTKVDIVLFGAAHMPVMEATVAGWEERGIGVKIDAIDDAEQWWFTPDHAAEEQRPVTRRAVEITTEAVVSTMQVPA